MSRHQFTRLALILVGTLALWGVLALTHRNAGDTRVALVLPRVDTASIDTVALTQRSDTALLVRIAPGRWSDNGHPAAKEAVAELIRGLADTGGWSEQVAENRRSHELFGVGPDSGQRVRVISRGKSIIDITTGHRTSAGAGLYVRRTASDPVYAVHGAIADAFGRPMSDWRDKHIVAVVPDSVALVTIQRPTGSYTLRRAGHVWRLATGARADSSAVATLLAQYRDLSATGFARPVQADSASFTHPTRRARLLRASGSALASLQFDSTSAHVWVQADSGGAVYEIAAWTLPQLLPADSTVRLKPKPKHPAAHRAGAAPPASPAR